MNTELRFLVAIVLMIGVLVGTNVLFPPAVPEGPGPGADTVGAPAGAPAEPAPEVTDTGATGEPPRIPTADLEAGARAPEAAGVEAAAAYRAIEVESPLYRFTFSNRGARLVGAELLGFPSFHEEGPVDLVPNGVEGYLGQKLVVGRDTVDLSSVPFEVEPAEGVVLEEGGGAETLTFVYQHPTQPFRFEMEYEFRPDQYQVWVRGRVQGLDRPLLVTDLGAGLAYAEVDSAGEAQQMAYVTNHLTDGIRSTRLDDADLGIVEGPFVWTAFRNKFFVLALLAGESEVAGPDTRYLGGLLLGESELPGRVRVAAAQTVGDRGAFTYRLFMGPQEYARLSSLGQGLEEVNPYGWRLFRPIIRPFVSIIMTVLVFLHTTLGVGYGWVLVIFGVLMRVVLWPLNHKAMRAQLRNMAVQPLLQEIQAKHKDNPEKLQKEMMRLYKEHGFNPLAGCVPMLLPWPILIALFFVFQNTIELRGVPFLWLPDLAAPDPLYILPVFMGASMFVMQWVSMKSIEQVNPQMKMMMWLMPGMMVLIFFNLASGLNLYYATANVATIPQQIWINNERKKMRAAGPIKPKSE